MAGTANAFNDYTDNANNKVRNFDLLSTWLFGKVNTGCLLVNLSSYGGTVLIPKKNTMPTDMFDLAIMSPQNKDSVLIILKAEPRWIDDKFSSSHKKIGLRFHDIKLSEQLVLNILIDYIALPRKPELECNILSR